ncbi:protease HtpX [Pseudohongiella nitratireducens]|jgi:heat shock protein HtpX|uniref:Protease HtpX n=1 Tax=Pseudohongiella nitratireducens TaxID=1768907 RepID=A0A917GQI5_9GAMM|nr:protease HtpX [Pseudohongiella nitratireducens]MDF1623176.1 protease HtpX [Pseudohongiella nitratireducens]GGG54337.1 protease HtpX [Pseudohongiella nitratireducens]
MKRIALFLLTNLAIVLVLSIVLRLLGVEQILAENGTDLDLNALLIFSAVIGFGGSFISLAMSKWLAKRSTGAQVISQPRNATEQWLLSTVADQAKRAGIKMPEVAIFPSPEVNAFATGASKNSSLVAVSAGLLNTMTKEEAEAVLAHEISHIANGDMVTLTLIQGVVNTFVIFLSRVIGHFVDRVVFKTQQGHGPAFWITSIVAQLVLGILASVIVMWFSRQREFRADAGGASLAGRQKMIAALERLKMGQPTQMPDELVAFGINHKAKDAFGKLFMSHPPLNERIERLRQAR